MDEPEEYPEWRLRFIAAFAAAEKRIGKDNGIFPKDEGWMTVHLTVDRVTKARTTRYSFDPAIVGWCREQNVELTVKTIMVLNHEMPYMRFRTFSDLLRFKLTFQ